MNKTIIFYINSLGRGGAERVVVQLSGHFVDAGYRTIVLTSYMAEDEYPVPPGVERISVDREMNTGSLLTRNARRIRTMRKICKSLHPVALVSFMVEANTRAVIATMGLREKTIISVRSDPRKVEFSGHVRKLISKWLLPFADGCVFQTEEARACFPSRLQRKSKIIFNEVGNVFFDTQYVGGRDVIALGRLVRGKNRLLLVDAFAKIADSFPDRSLLIYGDGEEREMLEAHIVDIQMQGRIRLMGITERSEEILKHAGVFVLSSDYEGMPNTLLEAMAVGAPCISTDCPCGGPRMVIENGENGLLVPVGDADAMATAIARVLSEPELAEKLSINALASAERFRPDIVFEQWKSYVEDVAGERE